MIQEENIDLSGIKINDTLCSQFFDQSDNLHPKIKDDLLKVVDKFKDHIGIDNLHIKDIVMTGSLANYNYNENSDIDVHILSDYSKIDDNIDLLTNFFKDKKDLWADKYDITIYGHPIELYVEDYNTALKKSWVGMYSLVNNEWLQKPEKEKNEIDFETLDKKSSDIATEIDTIISDHTNNKIDDTKALKKLDQIWTKIKNLRDKGLNKEHSEFALENLIFKVLRNNGYFDVMNDFQKEIYKKQYSIEENERKKVLIIKESQYNTLLKKIKKTLT